MGNHHVPLTINEDGLVTSVNNTEEQYERCIICDSITDVPTSTHIDYRIGYIEGAGQLCRECYLRGTTQDREMIMIPKHFIRRYPNDMELGQRVREFYYSEYGDTQKPDDFTFLR